MSNIDNKINSNRNEFIARFFNFLSKIDYALLKFVHNDLTQIGEYSDLDIAIKKENRKEILDFIGKNDYSIKIKIFASSFMDMVYIFFKDGSFLEIDLINNFKRKELVFLDISELISSTLYQGSKVKIPNLNYQFIYIYLFYTLNKVDIEVKYKNHFKNLSFEKKKNILSFLYNKYGLKIIDFNELLTFSKENYTILRSEIKKRNNIRSQLYNYSKYLLDTIKKKNKSMTITFSGVNGAGKTTILSEFKSILENKFRNNVIVLEHRPSLLPMLSSIKHSEKIAEKRTTKILPRTGSNKSTLSSIFRFAYYLCDYIIGQWLIFFKYSLRGCIIIYDSYYFDFIVDSKRANIKLNSKFIKFFYRFVFKPEINIVLFAPLKEKLGIKQEIDESPTILLSKKYKNLFNDLESNSSEKYVCIENIDERKTLSLIESLYREDI